MTSNTSCCHLEICRTTIVHCRMVHPFVSRKEQTILPRCLVSKTNCYNLQNIEVAAPSFSSVHSFGTQVRGTAFSPNVMVEPNVIAEHLHFESSQSCCSENRPCWMTSDASCCHLEICRTTIVHCRMVHPFVSWKEQTILQPGSCWQDFFPDPVPEKMTPLGNLLSPNFGIFKVQGVVPWNNIQRHWGWNQRKVWGFSERSLLETCKGINRTLATGTLSRDVCPHGPKIDSGYFLCTMYAWGLCPFLGMDIYSEKSLAPRNLSGINLGTTPVGTTHGDILPRCLVSKTNCYNLQTLKLCPVFHPFTVSGRRCGALRLVQMSSLSTCISKALSPACAVRIVRSEWHQTLVAVTLRFVGRRSFTAGWFIRLYHGKNRLSCQGVLSQRPIATTCKTLRLHPVFHPGFLLTLMMTWHCEGLCGQEDFLKLKHWKMDSEWYLLGREKMSLPRRDSSQKACRMNQTFTA